MAWRASEYRVALSPTHPLLVANGVTEARVLEIATRLGFERQTVDLVNLARACVGVSRYRRGARPEQAPEVVDCSTLTRWLFGKRGIGLRRYAVDQRDEGRRLRADETPRAGDLLFAAGYHARYRDDPEDGVGHVGVWTDANTVIHAANSERGVIEDELCFFASEERRRGYVRLLPDDLLWTFLKPSGVCIEHTDDLVWKVLESL